MLKIGLTGGIGSGKTAVSDRLAQCGAGVVDSDVVARRVTAPGGVAIAPIAAAFGDAFIAADGSLDRTRMRAHVFSTPSERMRLEAITHPLIRAETEKEAESLAGRDVPYLVFAVPLLVESRRGTSRFDRILVVDCSVETQVHRVMQRSQLDEQQVRAIIASQATRAERLAVADDVLLNDGKALADLLDEIDALHRRYSEIALKPSSNR
jgi:dephospho-CoA kinase